MNELEKLEEQASTLVYGEILYRIKLLIECKWDAPTIQRELEQYYLKFDLINKKIGETEEKQGVNE